jgi:HEAT repeat protein
MIQRPARILPLGAFLLILAPAVFGTPTVPPQGTEVTPQERVKNFAAAVRDVARIGGTTTPVLATLAKSESTATATLINWVGQSIKDKAAPTGVDTAPAAIEPQVKAMVAATRDLLLLRDRALEPLAAAAADPANADVKAFLEKADSRIHVALCNGAIRAYGQGAGTFWGMFKSLEKFDRDKIGDAFLDLLAAKGQTAQVRGLAGEGLAQLGSKRHLDPLRSLLTDPNNKEIRQRIVYTMAVLGDRTLVDEQFASIAKQMEGIKKPEMTPQDTRRWAEGFHQSAQLAQYIYDTDAALKFYEQFVAAVEPIQDKLGPKAGVPYISYYNIACLYSRKSDLENGFKNLEKSFKAGYSDYKWVNADGDLDNLRKDARFKAMLEKWESGKGGTESAPASKPS